MANTHTTLASLFTDIADAIREKTGETGTIVADNFPSAIEAIPNKGDYVWKKYSEYKPLIEVKNPSVSFTSPGTFVPNETKSCTLVANGFDFNDVEDYVAFLDGFKRTINSVTYNYFEATDGVLYFKYQNFHSAKVTSFDKSTGVITFDTAWSGGADTVMGDCTFSGRKVVQEESKPFLDYVVSDDPTAYPDGGEQDGYWYEKVVEGVTGIDFGEITITGNSLSITVEHNLGCVPSFVALITDVDPHYSLQTLLNLNGLTVVTDIYSNSYTGYQTNNDLTDTSITFKAYSDKNFAKTHYYWVAIA